MGLFDTVREKIGMSGPKVAALDATAVNRALSAVIDPDLHKDIVTLGFVRNIEIKDRQVSVEVNLTTPACPMKEKLKAECETALRALPGVEAVEVKMTATTSRGAQTGAKTTEALAGVKNIIAVAAGKGGVGKSTTAVNLAFALARTGSKVGILDADVYGPSVPRMVTIETPAGSEGGMVIPPRAGDVKVVSIGMFTEGDKAAMLRGPMAGNVIRQFLTQVRWGELDYLIIDYPPGTGDIQLTISQTAPVTAAVIVTTPQDVALIDVRKAVQLFKTTKVPVLGVIETMSWFICDGCSKRHHIFREGGGQRLARELGVAFLGGIPLEPAVAADSDAGSPSVVAHPESEAARSYTAAAGSVARQLSIINAMDDGALKGFTVEWQN